MRTFPRLDTPRLLLRAFASPDVPHLVALADDYEVARHTLNLPHPYQEANAWEWLQLTRQNFEEQRAYSFAMELKATGELLGSIGLRLEPRFERAEAGYWLGRPYWGQGLMSEALAALLRFGFEELGLHKICAVHNGDNPASGQVMLKNGLIKEGELVQHTRRDGQYHDAWCYRLLRAEYLARQAKAR